MVLMLRSLAYMAGFCAGLYLLAEVVLIGAVYLVEYTMKRYQPQALLDGVPLTVAEVKSELTFKGFAVSVKEVEYNARFQGLYVYVPDLHFEVDFVLSLINWQWVFNQASMGEVGIELDTRLRPETEPPDYEKLVKDVGKILHRFRVYAFRSEGLQFRLIGTRSTQKEPYRIAVNPFKWVRDNALGRMEIDGVIDEQSLRVVTQWDHALGVQVDVLFPLDLPKIINQVTSDSVARRYLQEQIFPVIVEGSLRWDRERDLSREVFEWLPERAQLNVFEDSNRKGVITNDNPYWSIKMEESLEGWTASSTVAKIQDFKAESDFLLPKFFLFANREFNSLFVGIDELEVGAFLQFILSFDIVPEGPRSDLELLNINALLKDVSMNLQGISEGLSITGIIRDFEMLAIPGRIPGLSGAHGRFHMNSNKIDIYADTDELILDLVDIFDEPWQFTDITGIVSFSWAHSELSLSITDIDAQLAGGNVFGRVYLDLPIDILADQTIEAQVYGRDIDAAYINNFIPVLDATKEVYDYVKETEVSGRVPEIDVYAGATFRGETSYQLHLRASVDQAEMTFAPDWPRLTKVEGLLEVIGDEVDFYVDSANLVSMQIDTGELNVRSVDTMPKERFREAGLTERPQGTVINLSTEFKGDIADAIYTLKRTPIAEIAEEVITTAEGSGPIAAEIDDFLILIPPQADVDAIPIGEVEVEIFEADIAWPKWGLWMTQTWGKWYFDTHKPMRSENLRGLAWGYPATINFGGVGGPSGDTGHIFIEAEGRIDSRGLEFWLEDWTKVVSGSTAFAAEVIVPYNDIDPVFVTTTTDMVGMSLSAPAPVGKTKSETKPTTLNIQIYPEDDAFTNIRIQSTQWCSLLDVSDWQFGATLHIDENQPVREAFECPLSDSDTRIGWIDVSGHIAYTNITQVVELAEIADSITIDEGTEEAYIGNVSVIIDSLGFVDFIFDELVVEGQGSADRVKMSVIGPQFVGDVDLPYADEDPVVVVAKTLKVPKVYGGSDAERDYSPIDITPFSLKVDELLFRDVNLGEWELTGERIPFGIEVKVQHVALDQTPMLIGINQESDFRDLSVAWIKDDVSEYTLVKGLMEMSQMNWILELIQESRFSVGPGLIHLNLGWQGSPVEMNLETGWGKAKVAIKDLNLKFKELDISGVGNFLGALEINNQLESLLNLQFGQGATFNELDLEVSLFDSELTIETLSTDGTIAIDLQGLVNVPDLTNTLIQSNDTLEYVIGGGFTVGFSSLFHLGTLASGLPTFLGWLLINELIGNPFDTLLGSDVLIKGKGSEAPSFNLQSRDVEDIDSTIFSVWDYSSPVSTPQ